MPSKLESYTQMADHAAKQVTGSFGEWTAFLETAGRLYKYPFHEQLMIFVQKPNATACAEYDLWNNRMGRYVRRGSKGIALIDTSGDKPRLKYVFDVSDTGGRDNSRRPFFWEYRDEHQSAVTTALEQRFGVSGEKGLAEQLEQISARLVNEYWNDNSRDILGILDDSFLEEYDDYNVGVAFKNAATVSTTYTLMSRCGLNPGDYYEHEDFLSVFDFNTRDTIATLGSVISNTSEQVLRQIEVTIKNYERESSLHQQAERTNDYGEQSDLHADGRLSSPESGSEPGRPEALGQVRQDEEELPAGAPSGAVEQHDSVGEPLPASEGNRRDGEPQNGADDARTDESERSDGGTQSQRPHEMGGLDEQPQEPSRGDDSRGADLQLNDQGGGQLTFFDVGLFPTEQEQINSIDEAESVRPTPFAFSFAQDDIDDVLRLASNSEHSRMVIASAFQKQKPVNEIVGLLKEEYHGGAGLKSTNGEFSVWYAEDGIHLAKGRTARYSRTAQVISWETAAERIGQLLEDGKYASNVELAEAEGYERMELSSRLWDLYGDLSDEAKEQGLLSTLAEYRAGGFPEATARLSESLRDPAFRESLSADYTAFLDAYKENRDILRFHFHKPAAIWNALQDLDLPRREYASDMAELSKVGMFITEDEIDAALNRGGIVEGGKSRIYSYLTAAHSAKEKADFLKNEYGSGGSSHAISGCGWIDHSSKGIKMKKPDCADVELNWNKVLARFENIIRNDRFFTPEQKARYEELKTREQQFLQLYNAYNDIKHDHRDDIVLFQVGDFYELYGEDAKTAAAALDLTPTTRTISGVGRVEMCGIPASNVEQVAEQLRENHGVTVAEYNSALSGHTSRSYAPFGSSEELPSAPENEAESATNVPIQHRDITQDEIDDALRNWKHDPESKRAVVRYMADHARERDTAAWLAKEYGTEVTSPLHITVTGTDIDYVMPWTKVQRRIAQLIQADDFYTDIERDNFDDIDPVAIRETLAERGIVNGEVVDPEALDNDPFIRQVMADAEQVAAMETPDRYSIRPLPNEGGIIGIYDAALDRFYEEGNQVLRFTEQDKAVEDLANIQRTRGVEQTEPDKPLYAVGDTVYLDDKPFIIESIGHFDVSLRDPSLYYPIFRAESKENFERLLWADSRNHAFLPDAKTAVARPNYQITVTEAESMSIERQMNADNIPYARSVHENGDVSLSFADRDVDAVNAIVTGVTEKPPTPQMTEETVAFYPAEENNLPFDIEIRTLRTTEPDPPAPKAELHNFQITDEHLGEGGAKAKFRMNMDAINLLKELEFDGRQATPEEQVILSKYVGWGGLADAFDETKDNWKNEFTELYTALSPEEYAAARSSTLNAHYTSPVVIKAIYEAVGNMGFETGNILEPSMGVGNFFGCLPETMQNSKLYGIELDSITGRIAKQLYPKADITVAGFETTDRRDFFDLAIGNVPFGQYQVNDRAYNRLGFSIHDYFFAKALDQVRPGGVVAFVTSRYTMDKQSPEVRKYIAQRADLLGAIRLPNNAFKANAGTEVVSDIIFLQKRDRPIEIEPDWVHLGTNADGFAINNYFIENPDMVLGRQTSENTQYGKQDFTVEPYEDLDLGVQLRYVIQNIHGTYTEAEMPDLVDGEAIDNSIPADPNVKNYSYTVVDGDVYYRENSRMVKPDLNATAMERVKGMVELRDCVQKLIAQQMDGFVPDSAIRESQRELNDLYDNFTAKYGLINSRGNALAFADDSSYYLLCSLEVLDEDNNLKRKADMFTRRTIKPHEVVTSVDTAAEALALSISEKACVDMPYMSQLTGKSEPELASDLRGVIYMDFDRKADGSYTWRTADDFLSGNVREKLKYYENALNTLPEDANHRNAIADNVQALRQAQPKDLDASEIEVRLGATWIDKSYIQQFMVETFDPPYYLRRSIEVNYSPFTAEWNITGKSQPSYSDVNAYMTYGTDRANAYKILEDTLNLRDVRIYDTVTDPDGKERRVLNSKETTLAQQKQQAIKDTFAEWIWKDPDRRMELVAKYNELFNSNRPREYDGSHITFSGMNPEIQLREHQLNAVAHILYGGNTLLAHEVGAGKTFEMVAAAMESKRLGLCQKPLFVVPNHLTEQWASEFLRLYPSANILAATKKDFEPRNRKKFCGRIATGDYDAIIIGHSQFERIPVSAERQERLLQEQIWEIEEGLEELKASRAERFTIKSLERTKKGLETRLKKLQDSTRKDDVITFEQLGVDRLYVDEAHNYKNLFLYTKMRNVAGLSTTDAQKSSDMLLKCRYIDEKTDNKGVVFATGTPVSNSMTELYTMMRYLQHDTIRNKGLAHFDCWASTFGETTTAIELAPEGTGYRARTRFAKFFNLPELMTLFKEAADIKTADQLNLPTPTPIYHNEVAQPTEIQKGMVQELSERAAAVHSGKVDPSVDNMLRITSDGRKLGLDQRIINPNLPDEPTSKVNMCVDNIYRIWDEGHENKLTQLVFCDLSTPKTAGTQKTAKAAAGNLDSPEIRALEMLAEKDGTSDGEKAFTVYDDIRDKLVARGVPKEQIAFIHEANTEARKKELFAKVRSGQVRVLMGSTFKMGAGMNVQDRLIALHDLDAPWRPGDLEQRSGRIIRQGNMNPEVHIYRYVTEATFDAYLWQTLENKQKFISQIMTSKSPVRACDDIDETALSYAEIKALCAGDERIKEKMDLDVDVARLKLMKASHQSQQYRLEDNLLRYFPEQIEQNKKFIEGFEADMKTLAEHPHPVDGFTGMTVRGDVLTDKENAGAAMLDAFKEVKGLDPVPVGSYRGFQMSLTLEDFGHDYVLTLKGKMTHRVTLGKDARGNLTRIDNALNGMADRLTAVQGKLDSLYSQMETAKAELGKPFPQEDELRSKAARLAELNIALNIDDKTPLEAMAEEAPSAEIAKSAKPSVLQKLHSYGTQSKSEPKRMKEEER
jgi:N12 class adenine-specific DNA methylase/adenine-specific DNA methylase